MILNAVLFNIAWIGLIILGNTFIPLVVAWLICHVYMREDSWQELEYMLIVVAMGLSIDSVLTLAGVFTFQQAFLIIPFWLITLWFAFAATLQHSLQLFAKSKLAQRIVGSIMVPFSYFAGHRLGAVEFSYSTPVTLLLLSVIWLYLFPFLLGMTKNKDEVYA